MHKKSHVTFDYTAYTCMILNDVACETGNRDGLAHLSEQYALRAKRFDTAIDLGTLLIPHCT